MGATLLLDLIDHYDSNNEFGRVFGDLEILRARGGAVAIVSGQSDLKSRLDLMTHYLVRTARYWVKMALFRRAVSNRSHFTSERICLALLRLNIFPNQASFNYLKRVLETLNHHGNKDKKFIVFHNAILPHAHGGYSVEDWFQRNSIEAVFFIERDIRTRIAAGQKEGLFERTRKRFGLQGVDVEEFIQQTDGFRDIVRDYCKNNHIKVLQFSFEGLLINPENEMKKIEGELGCKFDFSRAKPEWLDNSIRANYRLLDQ